MPRLTAVPLFAAEGLLVRRVACDGKDGPRPGDEGSDAARVIVVLRGRFRFEGSTGRAIASPARSLFLREGDAYRVRHLDETGDVCLALQGDLCRELVAGGGRARPLSESSYLRLRGLVAELAQGAALSRLAVEETLCSALAPVERQPGPLRSRERGVAEAIVYGIERDFDARLPLRHLAEQADLSLFHVCRLFKRVTGFTIHRYQQETRLRHALACLLETRRPIADIALDLGFANQGHFTNLFRRRFQTTPARVRRDGAVPSSVLPENRGRVRATLVGRPI